MTIFLQKMLAIVVTEILLLTTVESLCPETISNGTVDSDCDRKNGSICSFSCNRRFDINPDNSYNQMYCEDDDTWFMYDFEPVCIARKGICPNNLKNGRWAQQCQFNENETCTFECKEGFKQNENITRGVTCLSSEEWNMNLTLLCIDLLCPATIPNGTLNSTSCNRMHLYSCPFQCNTGYEKDPRNLENLLCENGTWTTRHNPACKEKKGLCTNYFLHGRFDNDCEFKENETCAFMCDIGFHRNTEIKKNITCQSSSQWDIDLNSLCQENDYSLIVTLPEDVYSDQRYLYAVPMESNGRIKKYGYTLFYIDSGFGFYSISGDYALHHIYAYDYESSNIYMYPNFSILNDEYYDKDKWKPYHEGLSKGFVKLSVDWVSHNIYWTDPQNRSIVVQSLLSNDSTMYSVLIHENLEAPHALALDPLEALLFWSDIGNETKIEVSSLTGENRTSLITSNLTKPYSLAADYTSRRIYFTDADRYVVETATYQGKDRKILVMIADNQFYDIALFQDYLYVTNMSKYVVYFFNKTSGVEIDSKMTSERRSYFGLTVFNPDAQPMPPKVYCADYGCQHICVTEKDGATCLCKEGYDLEDDKKSCKPSMSKLSLDAAMTVRQFVCLVYVSNTLPMTTYLTVTTFAALCASLTVYQFIKKYYIYSSLLFSIFKTYSSILKV